MYHSKKFYANIMYSRILVDTSISVNTTAATGCRAGRRRAAVARALPRALALLS